MTRTLLNLNDKLVERARKLTGIKSNSTLINTALRCLIRRQQIQDIRSLRGKIHWEGDLEEMRGGYSQRGSATKTPSSRESS